METQKKILLSLIAGLLVVSLLSFALAEDNATNETKRNNSEIRQAAKNATMTYGQCVAEAAKVKNDCFTQLRNQTVSCKSELNKTDRAGRNKTQARECKASIKTGETQCKATFKTSKLECAKIKHTFMESIRASFA